MRQFLGLAVVAAIAVGTWQLVVDFGLVDANTLPAPTTVADALVTLPSEQYFWSALGLTLLETLLGFVFGSVFGLLIAVLVTSSGIIHRGVWPWVTFLANLPAVALAPIWVGLLGYGLWSRVATAALICFFPVAINSVGSIADRDQNLDYVFRGAGASARQRLVHFYAPTAAEGFFAGIKTGLSLAFIGAVVAEFVAGQNGLGMLIVTFTQQYELGMVFGLVLVLAVIGLIAYALCVLLERKAIFWKPTEEQRP